VSGPRSAPSTAGRQLVAGAGRAALKPRDPVADDRDRVLSGAAPRRIVRQEIVASWHRSQGAGLTPDTFNVPYSSDVDLENRFAMAAAPVLDRLATQLSGMGMGVILTDADGQVLHRRAEDAPVRTHLDRILLAPGFAYAEHATGTNAIGTALAAGRALSVLGSEHFAEALQPMACYAAPVYHPISQRLEGLLDVTCLHSQANQLVLPLVTQAAREIERALYEESSAHERLLLQRFLRAMRADDQRPVVALGDRAMITNAPAARLLEHSPQALLWQMVQSTVGRGEAFVVEVPLSTGAVVQAVSTPVYDADRLAGAVLEFHVAGRAHSSRTTEQGSRIMGGGRLALPAGAASEATGRAQLQPDAPARSVEPGPLTHREHDVLQLIVAGCANKEIARRLAIHENTVKTHVKRIFDKLGVQSRTQAALHARDRGIGHPD
jgi:DNA-binding CsgD family transcriptional regulator